MSNIKSLIAAYEKEVSLPWQENLSGAEKVWFALYAPSDERRLRVQIENFEVVTKKAKHHWKLFDMTNLFSDWLAGQEYRDSYFEVPEDLDLALDIFVDNAVTQLSTVLKGTDEKTVVAVLGIATLFGLGTKARFSAIEGRVRDDVAGRMLVFFPGEHVSNSYRLLDARDGWNYLARPISGSL